MLSAFAALREKQPVATEKNKDAETETDSEADISLSATEASTKRKQSSKTTVSAPRKRRKGNQESRYFSERTPEAVDEVHRIPTRGYSPSDPTSTLSRDVEMREVIPIHPTEPLSSFSPSLGRNVFFDPTNDPTKVFIILELSEKLSFVGTVALTVLQGSISLFGSIIPASSIQHQVYAPKNYPVATMESVEYLSRSQVPPTVPTFMKELVTGSDAVIQIEDLQSGIQGLYQVCPTHLAVFWAPVETGFDFKLREFFPLFHGSNSYTPFYVPISWSSTLADIEAWEEECITAFVKGPKGSGKSMFTRMLINRLLLRHKKVAYLDCDMGQTEFTPPGMVSLHILSEPIYGPPFTHPRQPFRAHFVGSTTIRSSPRHYQECVTALLDTYRLDVKYSYDIDGSKGSVDRSSDIDEIEGIPLVINSFGWNKGLGAESINFIESQIDLTHVYTFEANTPETAGVTGLEDKLYAIIHVSLEQVKHLKPDQGHADRRSLMIMSYFHHHLRTNTIQWNTDLPLCVQPPWEVTWADAVDRIVLMGSGSEDVIPSEVLRVLNGAVVALIVVESSAPGWVQEQAATKTVPYSQGAMPPPPNCSKCVGFALVRGVRASSGSLHILTPVPLEMLAQARVLVMGEVKLPIWGMLDFRADAKTANQIAGVKEGAVPFLQWSRASAETPGAKRLRVRRNLMRKNQSFSHP